MMGVSRSRTPLKRAMTVHVALDRDDRCNSLEFEKHVGSADVTGMNDAIDA